MPSQPNSLDPDPAAVLAKHLGLLRHPDGGIVRLVQFAHDSPGLRHYKRRIAESLLNCLTTNGYTITLGDPKAVPTTE